MRKAWRACGRPEDRLRRVRRLRRIRRLPRPTAVRPPWPLRPVAGAIAAPGGLRQGRRGRERRTKRGTTCATLKPSPSRARRSTGRRRGAPIPRRSRPSPPTRRRAGAGALARAAAARGGRRRLSARLAAARMPRSSPGRREAVFLGLERRRAALRAGDPRLAGARRAATGRRPSSTRAGRRTRSCRRRYGFGDLRSLMAGLTADEAGAAAAAKGILGWHATHRFCAACGARLGGDGRRLAAHLPGLRGPALPADGPRRHHADRRRATTCCSAARRPGPRGCTRSWPASWSPASRSRRRCGARSSRRPRVRVGPVGYLASQPWPFPSSLMIGCSGAARTPRDRPRPGGTRGRALGQPRGRARRPRRPRSDHAAGPQGLDRAFPDRALARRPPRLTPEERRWP